MRRTGATDTDTAVARLHRLAELRLREQDFEGALVALQEASLLAPESAWSHFLLGFETLKMSLRIPDDGRRLLAEKALVNLLIAAQLEPSWNWVRVTAAEAYEAAGRIREAHEYLLKATAEVEVTDHMAYALGRLCARLRNFSDAIKWFARAVEKNPNHAAAIDGAASCHFLMGERSRGLELAKKAAHMGSGRALLLWRKGLLGSRRMPKPPRCDKT